jgi:ubiquinone biosynthesis protein UbiJ
MSLSGLALAALEAALNRYIDLDPQARARLDPLDGRVLALEILGLGTTLYLIPGRAGFQLLGHIGGPADCTISGTPLELARLGATRDQAGELVAGGARVTGDTELGQQFGDVLGQLDIDWEEQLSHLTGDLIAHQVGRGIRGLLAWGTRTRDSLGQDVQEDLQEEARVLPARGEVELFLAEVDDLRDDAERLEARVQRLESKKCPRRRKGR